MDNFIVGLLDFIVAILGFLGITAIQQGWIIAALLTGALFVSAVVFAVIRADRTDSTPEPDASVRPR